MILRNVHEAQIKAQRPKKHTHLIQFNYDFRLFSLFSRARACVGSGALVCVCRIFFVSPFKRRSRLTFGVRHTSIASGRFSISPFFHSLFVAQNYSFTMWVDALILINAVKYSKCSEQWHALLSFFSRLDSITPAFRWGRRQFSTHTVCISNRQFALRVEIFGLHCSLCHVVDSTQTQYSIECKLAWIVSIIPCLNSSKTVEYDNHEYDMSLNQWGYSKLCN